MTEFIANECNNPVLNGRYELLKTLGEGHTATVYLARDHRTQADVAVKIIKTNYLFSDNKARSAVDDEIVVMRNLDHDGIVKLHEHGKDGVVLKPSGRAVDRLVYMVMEYVRGDLLFDFQAMMDEGEGMGETYSRLFMHQLLDAIEHMHDKGIIHRDLKPENIIVDE